jgi:adenylyltransferase/sulfurtransferase
MTLSTEELQRYARHLNLPEIGVAGQEKIKQAKVLCVGAGGLGSPAITYLTAAGVGELGIIDNDLVETSNLQRQTIHTQASIGEAKVLSAARWVKANNPHVQVTTFQQRLSAENALQLIKQYDIVIDGTDNFSSRYLINDACFFADKPNIQASIYRFTGQLSVFTPKTACYRCVFPEPPTGDAAPSCAEGGVLGVLPGLLGVMQATEALKLITNCGEPLTNRMLLVNTLNMAFKTIKTAKNPFCKLCGERPSITQLEEIMQQCNTPSEHDINVEQLRAQLAQNPKLKLIDVREPFELLETGTIGEPINIPLNTLADNLGKLDKNSAYVVYCRSGGRSAKAVEFLRENGFDCKNLSGGILAWSA